MGHYRFLVDINARRDLVWQLWTNLERAHEWIEGLSRVTDVSGPSDQPGTTYMVHFGSWSKSLSTIVEATPPRFIRTRFGTWLLRGEQTATFEETPTGTRLIQTFDTVGVIPAISARIFAAGRYKGSFRGELEVFKRIAERDAVEVREPDPLERPSAR